MKINDYVKYEKNIYRLVKIKDGFVMLENIDIAIAKNVCKLLTPEETLEYFKGRFEKLGYELRILPFNVVAISKGIFSVCMNDNNDWEMRLQDNEEYEECVVVDVVIIDLIREFQNWYWRDK